MATETNRDPIDYRAALYADFPFEAHEIREGNKSKSGKIQWFVYIGREAIQERLDDLFFMRWGLTYDKREIGDKFFAVTACIAIDGVPREYNGEGHPRGATGMTGDVMKAAYTDAFRRAASMWGIGLYLQKTPAIWTDGYADNDWNAQKQRQAEAMEIFKKWFVGSPAPQQQQPTKQAQKPAASKPATNGNGHSEPPPATPQTTNVATVANAFPDVASAKKFAKLWENTKLTKDDILAALGVNALGAYQGTLAQATAAVNQFLLDRTVTF